MDLGLDFSGSDCANTDPESFLDGDGLAKTFRGTPNKIKNTKFAT
jgi:hypothetical protein